MAIPDEDEDEALLGLLAEPQVQGPASAAPAPPPDDDLAIPDEDEDAALGVLDPGDEDLLLLADEELMGLGG